MDLKWDAKAIFLRQKLNFSQNPIFISQSLFLDFRGEKTQQKRQRRRSNNQKSLGVTNTFYFVLRYVMVWQSMYNSSHVRNEFPLTRPYGGASFWNIVRLDHNPHVLHYIMGLAASADIRIFPPRTFPNCFRPADRGPLTLQNYWMISRRGGGKVRIFADLQHAFLCRCILPAEIIKPKIQYR